MRPSIARARLGSMTTVPARDAGRHADLLRDLRGHRRRPRSTHRQRRELHRRRPECVRAPAPAVRPPGRDRRRVVDRRGRRDRSGRRLRAVDPARRRARADRVLRPPRRAGRRRRARAPRARLPCRGSAAPGDRGDDRPAGHRSLSQDGTRWASPAGRAGKACRATPGSRRISSASGSTPTIPRSRHSRRSTGTSSDSAATRSTAGWPASDPAGCTGANGAVVGYALSPDAAAVGRAVCRAGGGRPAGAHRGR